MITVTEELWFELEQRMKRAEHSNYQAIKEIRKYLSPGNANDELIPLIRDLAQVALGNKELVETYQAELEKCKQKEWEF